MASHSVVIPTKSEADRREYRIVTLPNGLQATLVSDPDSTMAAAAMDVGVGSFSDPKEALGLAHFLEHMLFLGTEKYPDENSYSAQLAKFGGYSNAWTSMENTNFYFEVTAKHLNEMLDRFAQFFISPLFTESATDREMNAVNSEHQKNLQSDPWREFQLTKALVNPDHPMGRFATGNLETLRDAPLAQGLNVRDLLIRFHAAHYSAAIMKLTVVGQESLDTLHGWISDYFSPVKAHKGAADAAAAASRVFSSDVIRSPHDTSAVIRLAPVRDTRRLTLTWQLPATDKLYKTRPAGFLSHLLGHEGAGSLYAKLKALGWASALTAGPSHSASCFSMFYVSITLTEEGMSHAEEITECVYAYTRLLSAATDAELLQQFAEWAAIAEFAFKFKSKESASDYASTLANVAHHLAPEDLLIGQHVPTVADIPLLRTFLAGLAPRRALTFFAAKRFAEEVGGAALDKTERWYGTRYSATPIPETTYARYEKAAAEPTKAGEGMHLPKPNPFIPTDFSLRSDDPAARTAADAAATGAATATTVTTACDAMLFAALGNPRLNKTYLYCCGRDAEACGAPAPAALLAARVAEVLPSSAASPAAPAAAAEVAADAEAAADADADRFKWSDVPPQRIDVAVPVVSAFDELAKLNAKKAAANAGKPAAEAEGEEAEGDDDDEEEAPAGVEAEAEAGAADAKPEVDTDAAAASAAPAVPATPMTPLSAEERAPEVIDSIVAPVELWYKHDRVHNLPKAIVCLSLALPEANKSAAAMVMTALYMELVEDSINELLYDADIAQLSCQFNPSAQRGPVTFTFSGYSQRLPTLISAVLERLKTLEINPERFDVLKEKRMLNYANRAKAAAYDSARVHSNLVTTLTFHHNELAAVLAPVTVPELQQHARTLLSRGAVTMLVQGNASRDEAVALAKTVHAALALAPIVPGDMVYDPSLQTPARRTVLLQTRNPNTADPESAVSMTLTTGPARDPAAVAAGLVLEQMVNEPAYNILRTQEQLGYIVFTYYSPPGFRPGCFGFIIQSAKSPVFLDSRIEAFIAGPMAEAVKATDDATFDQFRHAVLTETLKNDDQLSDEFYATWGKISSRNYDFEWRQALAAALRTLTLDDVKRFYEKYIQANAPERRKLSSQVFGGEHRVPGVGEAYVQEGCPHATAVAQHGVVRLGLKDVQGYRQMLPAWGQI